MKKKILGILVCMLMIAAAVLPVAGFKNIDDNDVEDEAYHSTVANSLLRMTTCDTWDLRCSFDVEAASGAAGNAGAEFDGTYFYSTRWASNLLHQYDKNGVLLKEFSIPGVSGLRDLAWDGDYLYGGAASNTIYCFDPISETLITTIASTEVVRSIAYDSDNDAFWVNDMDNDITLVDRSGNILDTILNTISLYGSAYDNECPEGPYLWIFSGTSPGGGCQIEQYHIPSHTLTEVSHSVSGDLGGGIAGGLWFTTEYDEGFGILGGLMQGDVVNDIMFCYEICGTPSYVPGEAVVGFYGPLPYLYQDISYKIASKYDINLKDTNDDLCAAVYTGVDDEILIQMLEDPDVKYAGRNYIATHCKTPNDPSFPVQWGPKRIKVEAAWDLITDSTVKVAVVDTGIDYTHPDLDFNYATGGYDWINGDTDPKDDFGHGTHCAGIIGAEGDNGIGIAGVVWKLEIMAEKVLGADGSGSYWAVAQGITHACDQGAKIISLSLGGSSDSITLHQAILYAYNNGCLIVAASGNDGGPPISYPAKYPEVIAVGATDSSDNLAYFSSYGIEQELVAPGRSIYSTMPTYHVTLNDYGYSQNYDYLSGTSMACPHVAGVAALVWSINPVLTRDQVRCILRGTAEDLGTTGWDQYYGNGLVRADNSVSEAYSMFSISVNPAYQQILAGTDITFNFNVPLSYGTGTLISLVLDEPSYPLNPDLTCLINPDTGIPTFSGTVKITASPSAAFITNVLRLKATYTMGGCTFVRHSNFFTVANAVNPVDDIWIKTSPVDTGATNPRLGQLWTSPWIWSIPSIPILGHTNQLEVKVGNLNTATAVGPVTVQAWYNNYPSFIPIINFPTLGSQTITSIPAGGSQTVTFSWPLPWGYSHHICMCAQAWRPGIESFDPAFNIYYNNNIASHNFGPVYAPSPYTTTFTVENPTETTYILTYCMTPPNNDWAVDLCLPSTYQNGSVITRIMIPPGEQRNLTLTILMPPGEDSGFVDIIYSIEGYEDLYPNVYTFEVIQDKIPPVLETIRPKGIYLFDKQIIPFPFDLALVIGAVTITADASDGESGISKVEFYVGEELIGTDYEEPYECLWKNASGLFARYSIKAKAYDHAENSISSKEIKVWRFF